MFQCSSVVNQEFEQFNYRSWYSLSLSLLGLFLLHSLLALVIPSKSFLLFFKLVRLPISVWGLANQIAVGACLQVNIRKNGVTGPVPFHSSKSKLPWFCLILVSFQCFLIESWLLYFIQNLMLSVKCYRSVTRGKTLLNTFTHKLMLLLCTSYSHYLMFCCEHHILHFYSPSEIDLVVHLLDTTNSTVYNITYGKVPLVYRYIPRMRCLDCSIFTHLVPWVNPLQQGMSIFLYIPTILRTTQLYVCQSNW